MFGWLSFVTIGELRLHRPDRDELLAALNELIDEQQALIEAQQSELATVRRLALVAKREARDIAQLALESMDYPTPRVREALAELARDLAHSVAREEEHTL